MNGVPVTWSEATSGPPLIIVDLVQQTEPDGETLMPLPSS